MGEYKALIKTLTWYVIKVKGESTIVERVAEARSAVVEGREASRSSCFTVKLLIGIANRTLYVNAPYAVGYDTNRYSLPVRKLDEDPKTFRDLIEDWLYSLYITDSTSKLIAAHVVSLTKENGELDFEALLSIRVEEMTIYEEEQEDDLGGCAICLELDQVLYGQNMRLSCGHAYHKSCILTWHNHSKTCPQCRISIPNLP